MSIRRVATGEDADGKSRIVSDLPVTPTKVDGVVEVAVIWGADAPPTFPVSAEIPQRTTYYPPKGGYRFVVLTLPPEREASAARARMGPELLVATRETLERELGAGMFALWDPDFSGMHINDSVDLGIVLSGSVSLELDDGQTTTLGVGDTFVQNGTHHRWVNRGDQPARIALVLVGGR